MKKMLLTVALVCGLGTMGGALPAAASSTWDKIKGAGTGLSSITRNMNLLGRGAPILPFIIIPKGSWPYLPGSGKETQS